MSDIHSLRWVDVVTVLDGLSVGDAFGQQFFSPGVRQWCFDGNRPPPGVWKYTDDTEMALAIVEVLELCGEVDQNLLADSFARRYSADPGRGYGSGAHRLLREIALGAPWRATSRSLFGGEGSLGNGYGAMRVAPIGAYYADDFNRVAEAAAASAEVTHAHPEGAAGAIAVAVATAWCCQQRHLAHPFNPIDMFATVLRHVPTSATRNGIEQASQVPLDEWEYTAANLLGNGRRITVMDTVPFCIWAAAAHLDNYADALWATVRVEGDIDTNCAIVGGIVAAATGPAGIPTDWLRARESLGR